LLAKIKNISADLSNIAGQAIIRSNNHTKKITSWCCLGADL
jgi:hypothetical protein